MISIVEIVEVTTLEEVDVMTKNTPKKSFREKVRYITNCWEARGRVNGFFTGSSHGFHPHGFCLNGVLIYDHHNVNDYQTIIIANDPKNTEFLPAQNAPTAMYARALPEFVNGETAVWSDGKWLKRGSFIQKIQDLVDELYDKCLRAEADAEKAKKLKEQQQIKEVQNKDKKLSEAWK